jgi:hypothetical protein
MIPWTPRNYPEYDPGGIYASTGVQTRLHPPLHATAWIEQGFRQYIRR